MPSTGSGGDINWSGDVEVVPGYRGKRVLDVVLVATLTIPAVVMGALCAVAIKLTSRGPVLFLQERVGRGGRPFTVIKFRTMVIAPAGNPIIPDESRITTAGRWLRRFSLDELPQLVNVARGDMSIVGPRPTFGYQVARYDQRQLGRLAVLPGIVGLAQIRGRNLITWAERIEHDLEYVRTQSALLDLRILVVSLLAVVRGTGVSGHPADDPLARVRP